jgi:hypothetical protein
MENFRFMKGWQNYITRFWGQYYDSTPEAHDRTSLNARS